MTYNLDPCENFLNPEKLSRLSDSDIVFLASVLPTAFKKYRDENNIYHLRAKFVHQYISNLNDTTGCNFQGLKNIDSSCYLDSVLVCLFAVPNKFIDKYILKAKLEKTQSENQRTSKCSIKYENDERDLINKKNIQTQLRLISNSIQGGEHVQYCTRFREALSKYPHSEQYHIGGEKDAGEFLTYLLDIFNVYPAIKRTTTYGTNDTVTPWYKLTPDKLIKTSQVDDKSSSVIQFVDAFFLSKFNKLSEYQEYNIPISSFISLYDDSGKLTGENIFVSQTRGTFPRRISVTSVVSTPYLVFSFQRIYPGSDFIDIGIDPEEIVYPKDDSVLKLSSIVVYRPPGHYVAYFQCRGAWYFYDDLRGRHPTTIGSYKTLLQHSEIFTHGVLYFYQRIYE